MFVPCECRSGPLGCAPVMRPSITLTYRQDAVTDSKQLPWLLHSACVDHQQSCFPFNVLVHDVLLQLKNASPRVHGDPGRLAAGTIPVDDSWRAVALQDKVESIAADYVTRLCKFHTQQESCVITKMTARTRDACYSGSNGRYGHSKLSEMAACRQLGFDVTGNSAIRSADPENPTLKPNMKCIRSPVAQIRPFEIFQDGGRIWNPFLGKGRS